MMDDRKTRTPASRDFYLAYLNSPGWRFRRNAALRRVGFRCERCGSKRDLQVHHKTYDRLGNELDSDLEALCLLCHEGETLRATAESANGVYLKLASQALRDHAYASIAELSEVVKQLCAKHRIDYDGGQIHRALELVTGTRFKPSSRARDVMEPSPDPAIITAAEAHEILARLGCLGLPSAILKSIPVVGQTPEQEEAHEAKVREQARMMTAVLPQPRRIPVRQRLEAIFTKQPL